MSFLNELKRRNVLRVGAVYVFSSWLLIQVAETIFPLFGFGDAPARLVVIVLAIAFIPSLIFSWVFEITPEGLKRDADVVREHSITQTTGKKLDRIILIVLALALAYFAFDKFALDPVRDQSKVETARQEGLTEARLESYGDNSIAVLPFINMSADPEQEYFSDGISEELLNLLAQIPKLRVISRSSAFSFKGKDVATPTVAEQLNVAHVLEGSVRKDGNLVRITAQLIEARSDTHLWSGSYDRELNDILAVQNEIATAISDALKVKFALVTGEVVQPTVIKVADIDAYEAYLRGRELIHRRGRGNLEDAVRSLERALRLNEGFAPAHAQLAIAITLLVDHPSAYGTLNLEEVRRRVIPHLERAQELEPNLAEAHGGWALLAHFSGDLESTIEHSRKALASNPSNIDAMNWLYAGLVAFGRYEEAVATLEQLLVIDPLTIIGRMNYIGWLCSIGRIQEAHEMADQLLVQSPDFGYLAHADTSLIYEGKIAEGLSWALRAPASNFYVTYAFIWVGEYDEARRIDENQNFWVDLGEGRFDEAIRASQREMHLDPENEEIVADAADILYLAGRIDEALPLYERALDLAPEGRPILAPLSGLRAIWLALARRKAGDEGGAQTAAQILKQDLAAFRATGRNNPEQLHAEAMIAAFEHNQDRAIAAMKSALQLGLRNPQVFDNPIFEDLWDEPRFVALQQELDVILAAEHDNVLQLICFNNPAPNEWQPMPETCEGVEQQPIL